MTKACSTSKPYVLYRDSVLFGTSELDAIEAVLPATLHVESIPSNSVVFPRYRSLPFGEQLDEAVRESGSRLVNSWEQYRYVSNLFAWVSDLGDLTPPAYRVGDKLPEGEYFIKGVTNSEKHEWKTSAFAENLDAVPGIIENLRRHPVIGNQELVIRPFVRYRELAVQDSSQPVFNEHRVFVLNGKVMATGFYWMSQRHLFNFSDTVPLDQAKFQNAIDAVIERIDGKVNFVVIDLAEKTDGSWQVIELNDGNMSGLTGVDPVTLWKAIAQHYA